METKHLYGMTKQTVPAVCLERPFMFYLDKCAVFDWCVDPRLLIGIA